MKKLMMMGAGAVLVATSAGAAADAAADATEVEDMCYAMSETARKIMVHRQNNVPMRDLMQLLTAVADVDKSTERLTKRIVVDAYEKSRWTTHEMQKQAVQDFENGWYLVCISAFKP